MVKSVHSFLFCTLIVYGVMGNLVSPVWLSLLLCLLYRDSKCLTVEVGRGERTHNVFQNSLETCDAVEHRTSLRHNKKDTSSGRLSSKGSHKRA
jgi:hypothetical protein